MDLLKPCQLFFLVSPVYCLLLLRWTEQRGERWSDPYHLLKLCISLILQMLGQQAVLWFLTGTQRMYRITWTQIRAQDQ